MSSSVFDCALLRDFLLYIYFPFSPQLLSFQYTLANSVVVCEDLLVRISFRRSGYFIPTAPPHKKGSFTKLYTWVMVHEALL